MKVQRRGHHAQRSRFESTTRASQGTGPVHITDCSISPPSGSTILPGQSITFSATFENTSDVDATVTLEWAGNGEIGDDYTYTFGAGEVTTVEETWNPQDHIGWPGDQAGEIQLSVSVRQQGGIIDHSQCGALNVEPPDSGNGENGNGNGNGENGNGSPGGGGGGGIAGIPIPMLIVMLAIVGGVGYWRFR